MKIWKDIKDYIKMTEEEIKEAIKEANNVLTDSHCSYFKKIICITTKEIFNSIQEATDKYGFKSRNTIGNCLSGRSKTGGKHPITGEPLKWEYYYENKSIN